MKKSELEILEEKVKELKAKQAKCKHEWVEPYEDTFQKEITKVEWHRAGVDVWPYEYHTGEYETILCYARECKLCGKIERTTEMEDVVVKTIRAPKFKKRRKFSFFCIVINLKICYTMSRCIHL